MNREQKVLFLLAQFGELGIDKQIDYSKFCLYSIIANSTFIDGSTLTDIEVQLLLDDGISTCGRPIAEQLMVLNLKVAYEQAITYAKNRIDISLEMLNKLSSLVLKNTIVSDTIEIPKLAEFCESINKRRKTLSKTDIIECYKLSFDAHFHLVTIHPWADGNGRMFRLLMNQLQFEFGIIPTIINKDHKAEYIKALIATRKNDDIDLFRNFMFDEHSRNLELIIHNYQASMEYNGIQTAHY